MLVSELLHLFEEYLTTEKKASANTVSSYLRDLHQFETAMAEQDLEPPVTSGELQQQLKESHPMALTTLLTVLTRLADKKFVKIEKEGRSSRYFPLITRESYLAGQSRRFLDQLCGGSLSAFAAALCDSGLTREELDELRDLLERGTL